MCQVDEFSFILAVLSEIDDIFVFVFIVIVIVISIVIISVLDFVGFVARTSMRRGR